MQPKGTVQWSDCVHWAPCVCARCWVCSLPLACGGSIGGWGWKWSEAESPYRESKPSAHAPAPHARHDRSMARNRSVARPIWEKSLTLWATAASNVKQASSMLGAAFCHTYKLILTILEPKDLGSNQNVNKTKGISMISEFMIDSLIQNLHKT